MAGTFRSLAASTLLASLALGAAAASAQAENCTWGNGYWGTHSSAGPSWPDPAWAEIGESTRFFLSGMTYYQVIAKNSSRGNAYLILAQQWIAAALNVEHGAEMPGAVLDAFVDAHALFSTYIPGYDFRRDPDGLRPAFLAAAAILEDYNTGALGPGACR
jgi:hypothetical protein